MLTLNTIHTPESISVYFFDDDTNTCPLEVYARKDSDTVMVIWRNGVHVSNELNISRSLEYLLNVWDSKGFQSYPSCMMFDVLDVTGDISPLDIVKQARKFFAGLPWVKVLEDELVPYEDDDDV